MKIPRDSKPQFGSYIVIQDWMVKKLGLQGDELLIYAIIYGFSQDGRSCFTGTTKYLCFWTGRSKETVLKHLKSLRNKKMIEREIIPTSKDKIDRYFCNYWATITRFSPGDKEQVIHNRSKKSTCSFPQVVEKIDL